MADTLPAAPKAKAKAATARFVAPPHTTSATIGGVPYEIANGILEMPLDAVTAETIGTITAHGFVAE